MLALYVYAHIACKRFCIRSDQVIQFNKRRTEQVTWFTEPELHHITSKNSALGRAGLEVDGSNKPRTFSQETGVCVLCKTIRQQLLRYVTSVKYAQCKRKAYYWGVTEPHIWKICNFLTVIALIF